MPYLIDSATRLTQQDRLGCVLVGADRIAANGDVANKIGTYGLAVIAARHGIPFLVAAPESTVDESLRDGSAIVVEDRSDEEVMAYAGHPVARRNPHVQPRFRRDTGRADHRCRHRTGTAAGNHPEHGSQGWPRPTG